jgi:hypothetical protein
MKKPSNGFWQDSLNSLHPSVRIRYIPYFAMAESMDKSFDALLSLWGSANAAAMQTWRSLMR